MTTTTNQFGTVANLTEESEDSILAHAELMAERVLHSDNTVGTPLPKEILLDNTDRLTQKGIELFHKMQSFIERPLNVETSIDHEPLTL